MHAQDPASGPNRRRRPAFEGLESRSLLSAGALPAIGPTASPGFEGDTPLPSIPSSLITAPTYSLLQAYANQVRSQAQAAASDPLPSGFAARTNPVGADLQASQAAAAPASPTADEVAREYFTANFAGRYTIGAGRQAGQALTIHANNTYEAGSNQSLKGKAQLILFTPSSTGGPAASGSTVSVPGGQVTGLMSFFAQNYLQSGNLVLADVGATNQPAASAPDLSGPTTLKSVNGLLLPTQMPWAFDTTSAGAYTAPLGFTQGGGQLTIEYTPDAHPRAGTLGSGKIEVLLQGLMHTSTILNVVDKGFN